jgi:GDP-mannose 6-dehydrogenase
MSTVCADTSLNISPTYLRPGFAFGGSCLPKDLRALTYRANQMDLRVPLLESALPSNREHLARAVDSVLEIPHCRLGLIGLAFKESTDDLRESPVVAMLETLIGKGRNVRIFDPQIRLDAIYGSNKSFLLWQIPHIGRLLDSTIDKTLAWAEQLVVAQNLSPEIAERVRLSGLPVTNLVDPSLTYLKSSADSFAMA